MNYLFLNILSPPWTIHFLTQSANSILITVESGNKYFSPIFYFHHMRIQSLSYFAIHTTTHKHFSLLFSLHVCFSHSLNYFATYLMIQRWRKEAALEHDKTPDSNPGVWSRTGKTQTGCVFSCLIHLLVTSRFHRQEPQKRIFYALDHIPTSILTPHSQQ